MAGPPPKQPLFGRIRISGAWWLAVFVLLVTVAAACFHLITARVLNAEFKYTTDNGSITITGYTGRADTVIIPRAINGLPVTGIGDYAFQDCTNLTSVTIPRSVTNIGYHAFRDCSSLVSAVIPNSVTSIDGMAYRGTKLARVTIPASVAYIGNDVFDGCSSLIAISVDTMNLAYSSLDGVLFDKERTMLIRCPGGRTGAYTIPASVTEIDDSAFDSCCNLTGVTIPQSVTSIGESAFYGCTGLTSITIPAGLTSIQNWEFCNCTSLTNVTIPDSVTNIGRDAFCDCTSLRTVVIPNGVKTIGEGAFFGCTNLTHLTIPQNVAIGTEAVPAETKIVRVTNSARLRRHERR